MLKAVTALKNQGGFQSWHDKTVNRRRLRHRDLPVDIPGISELLESRTSAVQANVTRYVNKLEPAEYGLQVSAREDAPEAHTAARKVEDFGYALYHDFARIRSTSAYRKALDAQAAYGCGVIVLDFSDDTRETIFGQPTATADDLLAALPDVIEGNPFALAAPQLEACFWSEDMSEFCQTGERAISALADDYEDDEDTYEWLVSDIHSEDRSDNEWQRKVKVHQLHTRHYIYDIVEKDAHDGRIVQTRHNPAGRPWAVLVPGTLTSEASPEYAYLPLVWELYGPAQVLNILETLRNSGALLTGRNMWQLVRIGSRGDDYMSYLMKPAEQRPQVTVDLSEQMLANPPDGFRWDPLIVPDQQQVISAIDQAKRDIEQYGFPTVLSTYAAIDASSGYDRSQQMQAAADHLEPPLKNAAAAWHEINSLVFDIVKNLGISIRLPVHPKASGEGTKTKTHITINADDLIDYDMEVRLENIFATDEYGKRESDLRMVGEGAMSKPTLLQRHFDDPVAEAERIELDRLRAIASAKADQMVQQLLEEVAPMVADQVAAEQGVSFRPERPPLGSVSPGNGAPITPPVQTEPGQMGPMVNDQQVVMQ